MTICTHRKLPLFVAGLLAALLAALPAAAQPGATGMMEHDADHGHQGGMAEHCACPMMQSRSMRRGMGAERSGMMGQMGPMGPMGMDLEGADLEGIDLTPQQRNQVRELRQSHRQRHFERMARAMNLRDDLHMLMQEERPDPNAVQRLHGRMAEVHGEMLADGVRLRNAVRELLTPEQRQALQQRTMGDATPSQRGHGEHH